MNYELANELKDAGFPQPNDADIHDGTWVAPEKEPVLSHEFVYVPTLSELIEACGDAFHSLHAGDGYTGKVWFATLTHDCRKFIPNEAYREGSTPEEAVARLWLALNKV